EPHPHHPAGPRGAPGQLRRQGDPHPPRRAGRSARRPGRSRRGARPVAAGPPAEPVGRLGGQPGHAVLPFSAPVQQQPGAHAKGGERAHLHRGRGAAVPHDRRPALRHQLGAGARLSQRVGVLGPAPAALAGPRRTRGRGRPGGVQQRGERGGWRAVRRAALRRPAAGGGRARPFGPDGGGRTPVRRRGRGNAQDQPLLRRGGRRRRAAGPARGRGGGVERGAAPGDPADAPLAFAAGLQLQRLHAAGNVVRRRRRALRVRVHGAADAGALVRPAGGGGQRAPAPCSPGGRHALHGARGAGDAGGDEELRVHARPPRDRRREHGGVDQRRPDGAHRNRHERQLRLGADPARRKVEPHLRPARHLRLHLHPASVHEGSGDRPM
ncbi:MAG: hypothetical protein AVDCRST_MAG89-547, partial [uncultured Gemmatimonadetes bacterium]